MLLIKSICLPRSILVSVLYLTIFGLSADYYATRTDKTKEVRKKNAWEWRAKKLCPVHWAHRGISTKPHKHTHSHTHTERSFPKTHAISLSQPLSSTLRRRTLHQLWEQCLVQCRPPMVSVCVSVRVKARERGRRGRKGRGSEPALDHNKVIFWKGTLSLHPPQKSSRPKHNDIYEGFTHIDTLK